MKILLVPTAIIFSILTCNSAIAISTVRDCKLMENEMLRCISNIDDTFVQAKVSKTEAIQINKLTVKIVIILDKLIVMAKDTSLDLLLAKFEQERSLLLVNKMRDNFKGNLNFDDDRIEIINIQIKMINNKIAQRGIKVAEYEALIKQIQDKKDAYYK